MDERVASAISHWKPRFTANGVAPSDFERITALVSSWGEWCRAWSDGAKLHEDLGREALAAGRTRSAGAHLSQAAVYYHFAKFVFVQNLEEMRAAHAAAVRCLDDALPYLDPPGERHEIPFDGATIVGILRRPAEAGDCPAVIMIPGLDSAKEELRSTEELFLERGLATFSVDGPGQGEAEYDLPIRGDWEVPGAAIFDFLSGVPGIDPQRIGVWGVSLGGYYAPRVVSGVTDAKACIGLAGPYNFGWIWEGLPQLTRETFQVRSRARDEADARGKALNLSLEGRTQAIKCPLLIVTGKLDRIIPWEQSQRVVDEVGENAEMLLLEDGNHGCANVAYKHRHRSADWMAAHLLAG